MRRLAVLLVLAALACSSDGDVAPSPTPNAARARLAELAAKLTAATYDARYTFTAPAAEASGTLRIVAAPARLRLEIAGKTNVATFLDDAGRKIACDQPVGKSATCLLVAGPGEEAPAQFDPGIQRIFGEAARDLAENPGSYGVTAITALPATAAIPGSECFQVQRIVPTAIPSGVGGAQAGFETGQYCFATETGVITGAKVPDGALLLTSLQLTVPPTAFNPPASPVPLASPSPTPSR
jgi:hypothetical protein